MTPLERRDFFAVVRKSFGKLNQKQVDGFNTVLDALTDEAVTPTQAAYLLATAWHETAHTMQPVRETLAHNDATAISRLERAWKSGRLNVKNPYWKPDANGKSWFGRGHVQLTHQRNYQAASELIGIDLVADPALALDPAISALILVRGSMQGLFTGKRLSQYINADSRDYVNARRVINGTDRALDIAAYATRFERALC